MNNTYIIPFIIAAAIVFAAAGQDDPRASGAAKRSDLNVSVIEAPNKVMFVVTSRATGRAVFEAGVRIAGVKNDSAVVTLARGRTRADGTFTLSHTPEREMRFKGAKISKIIAFRDADTLVINAGDPEAARVFTDNHRYRGDGWLGWMGQGIDSGEQPGNIRGFVRTERSVYHTNDTVFVKGYVREAERTAIKLPPKGLSCVVRIRKKSSDTYTDYPVTLNDLGGFDVKAAPRNLSAGEYEILLLAAPEKSKEMTEIARTDFAIGTHYVPPFEIQLNAEERAANNSRFKVRAVVSNSAGKPAAGQKVVWKVTAHPHDHRPRGHINYLFSSRKRGDVAVSEEVTVTDKNGHTSITLNSKVDNVDPIRYIVEAVVGDAVSARRAVLALPTLTLGLRTNRYVTSGSVIAVRAAAIGINDSLIVGHWVRVSLKKISRTRRGADGDTAAHIMEETEELLDVRNVRSEAKPRLVEFKNLDQGEYLVELTSLDRVGRRHTVSTKVSITGDRLLVQKPPPPRSVFEIVTDRNFYEPGQQAKILLRSPHKTASVLAVVEKPDGELQHRWINVTNGQGVFTLDIKPEMTPGIPVTFLLTRPSKNMPESETDDLDAVFNTTMIAVSPAANMLDVRLIHAPMAATGSTLDITVSLMDIDGRPRAGEAALWMAEESIMPLGARAGFDPLNVFVEETSSNIRVRDTRIVTFANSSSVNKNQAAESDSDSAKHSAGSDGKARDVKRGITAVPKNPQAVFYWNPSIKVDKSGIAVINIPITQDQTNYIIRAVAVSGPDRFGTARSRAAVRHRQK